MSTTDQFLLALQAYQEIQAELRQSKVPPPVDAKISISGTPADQVAKLPGGSLLLGLAEDGLTLLLDLYEPVPGPLLVAGDGGSGKTTFLQSLAQSSDLQNPGEIQFGVLTPFPEEWTALETLPNCLGIWPAYHSAARDFLSQLVSWADILSGSHQAVLVLFDGLDLLTASGFQVQHDLRWLLMYGPERQVWPVVTVNPGRLARLETWLAYFQTRILGQVKRPQTARLLVGDPKINLAALLPGKQFGLSRPEGWLKFWLPPVE
ncbi:MAG TPA: hypothetical protein VII97_14395 [Anaerolineales bacterium]